MTTNSTLSSRSTTYISQMECEEMEKTKEEKERQEARMNTLEGKKNEVGCSEKKQRRKFQSNTCQ